MNKIRLPDYQPSQQLNRELFCDAARMRKEQRKQLKLTNFRTSNYPLVYVIIGKEYTHIQLKIQVSFFTSSNERPQLGAMEIEF